MYLFYVCVVFPQSLLVYEVHGMVREVGVALLGEGRGVQ